MKKYSISCILLIVIYTIFAHNIPNDKIQENKIKEMIMKRAKNVNTSIVYWIRMNPIIVVNDSLAKMDT